MYWLLEKAISPVDCSQQQYAFGFQSLVAGDWYLACAPSSEDAQGSGTCLPGSGTCLPGSGTFGTLSPIIVFLSMVHQGFGASSGFRDSWTFVSLHCVSSASGTCLLSIRTCLPGSGTFGTLSPIIVFFLVVYQGSGIFGTLSPIIVFVLWSIRARDFIRVPGFLDFCFPSLCFFWFRDLSPEYQDLSPGFRDFWNLVSHHCVFSCGLSGLRDFWKFVSHHCVCSVVHQGAGLHQGFGILGLLSPIIVFFLVVYEGSGIFGTLSPIIVFVLWSIRARDFIRVPGFLDFCFPSLCFFWFRDLSPEFQDLSPGFRDLWNLVSHHCVFSCGL